MHRQAAQLCAQLKTVHARHVHVQKHQVERIFRQQLERDRRVFDVHGLELGFFERVGDGTARQRFVIHDEIHYLDDPEATAQALSPDGWLRTGDLGVLTDAGCLRIVGRLKDMFIVGGFNAYPAEIENELLVHPAVAQAAVVGIPDERLGEVGCAFIVPRSGQKIGPDEIISWARNRMANYKVPRRVEVVSSLPLNASGKVLKYELRERVRS